mgnify:CR=1 FL=1
MIDTDKYEIPKYEDAKKVVQDAGLIEENDGHPDIFYRKIAQLLTEVKRLREMYEEATHHLDLMVGAFGIEALVEMVGEEE